MIVFLSFPVLISQNPFWNAESSLWAKGQENSVSCLKILGMEWECAIISGLIVGLVSGINIGIMTKFWGLRVIYVKSYSFRARGFQEKWSVHRHDASRNTHERCVYSKLISLFYSVQRDMMHYNQPDTLAWRSLRCREWIITRCTLRCVPPVSLCTLLRISLLTSDLIPIKRRLISILRKCQISLKVSH